MNTVNHRNDIYFVTQATTQQAGGQVRIFDTTLRDGEQTPGVHISADQKVDIARRLEALKGRNTRPYWRCRRGATAGQLAVYYWRRL